MDDEHDLSSGQRRGSAEHARAAQADGGRQRKRARTASRSGVGDFGDRSPSSRNHSQRGLSGGTFWRAAGRQPHSMDRQGPGQRPKQGGMERPGGDKQDFGYIGREDNSSRWRVRARRSDAVPQPGANDQTDKERAGGRNRGAAGGRE